MRLRALASLLAAATIVAAIPAAAQDADAKELAAYRLTKANLDRYVQATRTMILEMQKDPKVQEAQKLAAEIKSLREKEELTPAEETRLENLIRKQEEQEEKEESTGGLNFSEAKTLDDMEARLTQMPQAAAALKAAGFPPREYAKFTLVLFQSAMVAGFKKAGMVKELPKEVAPENVKFVEDHEKDLEAMRAEMEALASKKGGPPVP